MDEAELAKLLVDAWTEALGLEATPESDFFALGGTSIAAVSIAQTVVDRFERVEGIELFALQAVFEQPTLGDMARELVGFLASARPGAVT